MLLRFSPRVVLSNPALSLEVSVIAKICPAPDSLVAMVSGCAAAFSICDHRQAKGSRSHAADSKKQTCSHMTTPNDPFFWSSVVNRFQLITGTSSQLALRVASETETLGGTAHYP
jgi:hypothetical protein